MGKLIIKHNAGFFSCCCIRLLSIVDYYNNNKILPETDSSTQLEWYKSKPDQDLWSEIFNTEYEKSRKINLPEKINLTLENGELQFTNYKLLNFRVTTPLMVKYFMPTVQMLLRQNKLFSNNIPEDYWGNLCSVFYRGNDKNRETSIATYQEFINKAKEIQAKEPNIKFIVQPDETEFLQAFKAEFPDAIHFQECQHMPKKDSCIMLELPKSERPEHAKNYLASVLIMAQSKHLITHSGNGGLFSVLFRGNSNNVHQYLNGIWL